MILSVNKRYLSLVFIFSSFLALLEVVFFVLSLNEANGSDFISYYTGAYTIRTGEGSKLYDLQVQYDNQQEILFKEQKSEVEDSFVGFIKILPYVNIPPLALFIIPLTFIPFIAAYKLFVLANLLLCIIIIISVPKVFNNIRPFTFWVFLPLLFYPSFGALFVGQITPLLLLLLITIYYFLKTKKYFLVGVLSGLLFLKMQYVVIIPYLLILVPKKLEYIKGLLISALILLGLSFMIAGPTFITDYLSFVFSVQKPEYGVGLGKMFTLHASLIKLFGDRGLFEKDLLVVNSILYFISIYIFSHLKKIPLAFKYAVAIIWMLVFSIHSINYDYSLILIPIFILINIMKKSQGYLNFYNLVSVLTLILLSLLFLEDKVLIIPFALLLITIKLILPTKTISDLALKG